MAGEPDNDSGAHDTDAVLVESARRGDRDALGHLLSKYRANVVALCRKMLGDIGSIDDAAQETGLLVILNISRLQKPAAFRAWLYGIGLNVCHRLLHEQRYEASLEDWLDRKRGGVQPTWDGPGPEELGESAEVRSRVRAALDTLPRGQRAAATLFYLSGLRHREAAALLGTSVNAIKARLHKGRTALRRQLWDLWEGAPVDERAAAKFVPVRVVDVRHGSPDTPSEFGRPAPFLVLLQETNGTRRFPVWVGRSEASWIALSLEGKELIRPGTFQFANNLLTAAGGRLKEVRITKMSPDETIYAEAVIDLAGRCVSIDARPSDALNLAMLVGAPVAVEANLLEAQQQRIKGYITDDNVLARVYPDGPRELASHYESKYIKPRGKSGAAS